jgi:uncharacterized protein (DUF1330 family)
VAAYLVVEVVVGDSALYDDYRKLVPSSLDAYAGSFVVRGGAAELLEGEGEPGRMVVIRFESSEQAKAWWDSDAYRPARALRQKAATTRMILVEGVV